MRLLLARKTKYNIPQDYATLQQLFFCKSEQIAVGCHGKVKVSTGHFKEKQNPSVVIVRLDKKENFKTLCSTWGHTLSSVTWSSCCLLWWTWGNFTYKDIQMVSVTNLHLIREQEKLQNLSNHYEFNSGCLFFRTQKHFWNINMSQGETNSECDVKRWSSRYTDVCVLVGFSYSMCVCVCWFMWSLVHKNLTCWSAKCKRKPKHRSHRSTVHDVGVTSQLAQTSLWTLEMINW